MMWILIVLGVLTLALVVARGMERNAKAQAERAEVFAYQERVAANQQFDVPVSRIANDPGRMVWAMPG